MTRPVIGIPARHWNLPTKLGKMQTVTCGINAEYTAAVLAAGGAPVLLARTGEADAAEAAMERIDGLLLPGGGDIVSLAFGREPHPENRKQDPVVDEHELAVTTWALEAGMPILGLCRGIQMLAVALGGDLVQHIPDEIEGALQHWAQPREVTLIHTIDIEPDSRLAEILGTDSLAVNSYHHQAVREPGDGMRVVARSRDGVVEATEAADGRPVVAVQCHPEELAPTYPEFRKLFEWLVHEATENR